MRLLSSGEIGGHGNEGKTPHAAAYVRCCTALPASSVVSNVKTQMMLLDTGRHQFPLTKNIGNEELENSYVVSPFNTYTRYAKYELSRLGSKGMMWPLHFLIAGVAPILKSAQIDRIVQVNNWLLSTNLYPSSWDGADVPEITRYLVDRFPDCAIGFRSLNRFSNAHLIDQLSIAGYLPVPSRQVYLFDGRNGNLAHFLTHHNVIVDAILLRKSSYQLVPGDELNEVDFERIEQLYGLLYLEKYCTLNPQFTASWLRRGQSDGWLKLLALRGPKGNIDGALGWFSNTKILTAPIVGYDIHLPQRIGLYRLLTQICLQEAVRRNVVLNFSSGAAHFKRLRGGHPEIEYSMVYVGHLPKRRQMAWHLLSTTLRYVGVPVMKAFKL